MGAADMQSKTVAGLMAYCDYLKDKGYAGQATTDSWKSAAKVVFETVEGESYEALSLDGIDLDDYIGRFQTLGGSKYRAETVARYKNRIRYALDAQAYYIEHRKPPEFRRGAAKHEAAERPAKRADSASARAATKQTNVKQMTPPSAEFFEFTYPLSPGRIVRMELPYAMSKREVDRLCTVLQTLEEQPQLPPGRAEAA